MNDSFLEDFELVQPKAVAPAEHFHVNEKNITTRKALTPPKFVLNEHQYPQDKIISASNIPKAKLERRSWNTEGKRRSANEPKLVGSTPTSADKKTKIQSKERRSVNIVSNCSDGSAKENSKPKESSRESSKPKESSRENKSQETIKEEISQPSNTAKQSDDKSDPVTLLKAVKEIVKTYSEQEAGKVLKTMHDLHLNSQVNMIRHLMLQSSEIISEMNSRNNPSKIQQLVEENERMREDLLILRTRNDVLQKKVNEAISIREENLALKLKLKELQKQ